MSVNDSLQHWLQLAESHLLLDQLKPAEKYFRKASREDPTHLRVLLGLARIAQKRGKIREAMQQVEYALKVDPQHLPALLLLAELYRSQQAPLRALPLLEKAYEIVPENPEALLGLAQILVALQNWDRARFFAKLLIQLKPDMLTAWETFRDLSAGEGDILNFAEASNQIARLDPQRSAEGLKDDELQRQWETLSLTSHPDEALLLPDYSPQELEVQIQALKQAYHQES
ncbi:MAG: tetratricopeptide repeat protein [Candidatus Sericytochromatia bacterium]